MYDTNRREENIYGPFQRIWSELSFETIYSDIYRYIFLIKSVYRCCVTLKIKRGKIWNKNLEKFDQLLPKTLVPKKHRRKIYRGKARFKKWLVTRQSDLDITFLDGHIPLPFIVARCHATQCFNRPFTIKGEERKKRRNGTSLPKLARYFLRTLSFSAAVMKM